MCRAQRWVKSEWPSGVRTVRDQSYGAPLDARRVDDVPEDDYSADDRGDPTTAA